MSNELQILDLQLDLIKLLEKANPYHDRLGRFTNRMGQKGVPSLEHLDLDWSKIPSHLRHQAQKTLKDWTGDEALAIQHHLRGRSSVDEDKSSTIRVLDEVFQHAPRLTRPAVLYRYSDNIPKNFHDPEFFNTNWEKVGAIFTEPGYTATDPNASFMIREHQKVVQGFQGKTAIPTYPNWSSSVNQPLKAYLIRIHVPAGTRALDLGRINQKGEKEVLLNRSSTFRVVDVNTHDPHGVILDWELVRNRVEKAGPPDEPRDKKGRWTSFEQHLREQYSHHTPEHRERFVRESLYHKQVRDQLSQVLKEMGYTDLQNPEFDPVRFYVQNGMQINTLLRKGPAQFRRLLDQQFFDQAEKDAFYKEVPDNIEKMTSLLSKANLSRELVTYRGLIHAKKFLDSLVPGVEVRDKGFVSTTASNVEVERFTQPLSSFPGHYATVPDNKRHVLEIITPKNAQALPTSDFLEHHAPLLSIQSQPPIAEVTHQKGSVFEVLPSTTISSYGTPVRRLLWKGFK